MPGASTPAVQNPERPTLATLVATSTDQGRPVSRKAHRPIPFRLELIGSPLIAAVVITAGRNCRAVHRGPRRHHGDHPEAVPR